MIEIVPYRPEHLAQIALQDVQVELGGDITDPAYARRIDVPGLTYTGIIPTAYGPRVVGAAGILPIHRGVAGGWCLFGDIPRRCFIEITGRTLEILWRAHERGFWRIETFVRADHARGLYYARKLGFHVEGLKEAFLPSGGDVIMYARLHKG